LNGHLNQGKLKNIPFCPTQARQYRAASRSQEIVTVELVEQARAELVSKLFKLFPIPVVIAAHHHPVSIGKLSAY